MLGVFAHPDDEFAVSGLISKFIFEGNNAHLVCATKGEAGRIRNKKAKLGTNTKIDIIREDEYLNSCNLLGVHNHYFLNLINGQSSDWNIAHAVEKLVEIINEVKPTHIVSFDDNGGNGHPDHKAIAKITEAACRQVTGVNLIWISLFPREFMIKKLWWMPNKVRNRIISKVSVKDDKNLKSIN